MARTLKQIRCGRRWRRFLRDHDPAVTDPVAFLGAQFDAGLAWVANPPGLGGLGLGRRLQALVQQALSDVRAPNAYLRNPLGYGMGAPTLLAHGTDAQLQRYLRPLFTGEEVWCQLFSDPGAGSDLASLATRAVRDGDAWIVNGQKVWTTMAHRARVGMLLARTNPQQPKHQGITYFLLDMSAEGVEVKPLRQMTGDAEFNEVYMDQVRVPDSARVGAVGEGWKIAMTTLMNERASVSGASRPKNRGPIAEALKLWRESERDDPVMRERLLKLWIGAETARLTSARAAGRGQEPGPDGAMGKLAFAELNQSIYEWCIDLLGPAGMLYPSYEMRRPDTVLHNKSVQEGFLRSQANSIEGGTTFVLKNVLAERVLGLPGDVRLDKDKPWAEVPRS